MATIGSLTADLKLESAQFISGMKQAADATAKNTRAIQSNVSGLQKSFESASAGVANFVKGFLAVQTVRTFADWGRSAIQMADDVGAAATRLGVNAEALQRFRFAAEQADVSTESLDKALKLFSQNLAQGKIAAQGDSITQSFQNYIKLIDRAPTQLEKVRLAQQAFGKSWQVALSLAAQGAEEFKKQSDDAFIFSQKTIDAASELDNQFRAVEDAVKVGFATGFIDAFSGALDNSRDSLVNLNLQARDFGTVVGAAFRDATALVTGFLQELQKVNEAGQFIADWLNKINQIPLPELPSFEGMREDLGLTTKASDDFNTSLGVGVDTKKQASEAQAELNRQIHAGVSLAKQAQSPTEEYTRKLADLKAALDAGKISAAEMGQAMVAAAASATEPWLQVADNIGAALGTMFKDNKAVAIVQAIINTAQAITKTIAEYGFSPLGVALAASAAALGAAQIATIKSQKAPKAFHGGSFKVAGAGGMDRNLVAMSLTRGEQIDVTPAGKNRSRDVVTVNIPGWDPSKLYTGEQLRKLMEAIGGALDDGASFGRNRVLA